MIRISFFTLALFFTGLLANTKTAHANERGTSLQAGLLGRDFGCPAQGCSPPGTGKFGCPAQGCSPPGTGKFGCPAQGCSPPGTGKFGCPAQGCSPPGTGKFGCPAQGCSPPGTGKFGCPAQGCNPGLPNQPRQITTANGSIYDYVSNNTYRDPRTGQLVRVLSYVNGVAYLSNGQHVFLPASRNQPSPQGSTNTVTIAQGVRVTAVADGGLFIGSDTVGQYQLGHVFTVQRIQNGWFSLKDQNGDLLPGWALIANFAVVRAQ